MKKGVRTTLCLVLLLPPLLPPLPPLRTAAVVGLLLGAISGPLLHGAVCLSLSLT